jgi:serine/threonine-protein kinase
VGAALIAAAATVAVVVSRGDSGDSASGGPGSAGSSTADPARDLAARANELAEKGERDAALELLHRGRRQYPDNALLAYAAGRICFSKYYWTEGLRDFRDAIRIEPAYRSDAELIKTVLRGFNTTPSYNDDLASFLRDEIGSAVQPLLEETARDHPNSIIRSRAAAELRRYH